MVVAAQSAFAPTRDALVYLEKKTPKKGPEMPLPETKRDPSLTAAVVLGNNCQKVDVSHANLRVHFAFSKKGHKDSPSEHLAGTASGT